MHHEIYESWSAGVLCDPICSDIVSKGQFMLCLAALDHSKSLTSPSSWDLTCRKVLAPGALVLSMMERMEKMMIWMVAPPAYQYGPLIPYCNERGLIAYPRGLMWWAVICSMFISLGALLADKIGYSWCLQCLIRARAELQIVIDSWGKQGVNMKQQQEEESKLLRGHTTGVAAAFTAEIPRPWAEPTLGRSSTCCRLLLLLERNLLLLSNVYNDLTSSWMYTPFISPGIGAFVTNQWTWVHPIWSTPLLTLLMFGSSLYSSVLVILLPPTKHVAVSLHNVCV